MNEIRLALGLAVLRGSVYAMGGRDDDQIHRTAERYDCKANQWSWIAPMNTKRYGGGAAVLNDKIYVAGGSNIENFLNSVEVYDPDTDQWTFVAPMLSGRDYFSFVEFHGCLYALGGGLLSSEQYDPAEDTWIEIPDMDSYSSCAEVMDDMIFVIYDYFNQNDFYPHVICFNGKENR
ncbi:kelch-like protein 5, partial [Zootermopsis nevadensis]|uniref:kelch-like protein 5 n=1 Tax=Zootermopsis nevadensis TaxID=136037 RepID=UPI000B8E748A